MNNFKQQPDATNQTPNPANPNISLVKPNLAQLNQTKPNNSQHDIDGWIQTHPAPPSWAYPNPAQLSQTATRRAQPTQQMMTCVNNKATMMGQAIDQSKITRATKRKKNIYTDYLYTIYMGKWWCTIHSFSHKVWGVSHMCDWRCEHAHRTVQL